MEEVHLWRGSLEERALRNSLQKRGQFKYFDRQLGHPEWSGKRVLDFGGNRGNLLGDADGRILPQHYYCLDVIQDAIDEGRALWPAAHWFHYNRYNCSFNPEGLTDAPIPDLGAVFDFILAFSVFTHVSCEEMHDLVSQLCVRLAPGGCLAFTFIDPHYSSCRELWPGTNLERRLEQVRKSNPEFNPAPLLEQSQAAEWCTLVDGSRLCVDSDGVGSGGGSLTTYHVFYTAAFLQRQFPDATILPPVEGEVQHCCLIG